MNDGSIKVSIVIRCKDEAEFISQVLEKIFEQDVDFPYEVIVIDSGSTDGTVEQVKQFPVRLIEIPAEDFTYSYALNLGVKESRGDFVVNISAHAVPFDNNWLKYLTEPVMSDEEVAGCSGREIPHHDANLPEKIRLDKWRPFQMRMNINYFLDQKDIEKNLYDAARLSNANGCVRRELLVKYPFKEEPASEDKTWALMILKKGYSLVYEPRAVVYHSHNDTIRQMAKRWARALISESYRKGGKPTKYLGFATLKLIRADWWMCRRYKAEPWRVRYKWALKLTVKWLIFWTYIFKHTFGLQKRWH